MVMLVKIGVFQSAEIVKFNIVKFNAELWKLGLVKI